ncbi:hypothetical protein HanHA300_Chr06g0221501 [Helianthus annuus]|nr:hypothetical protein HanHA300_Chr06g0221501 [Helianthus annuus]
MKTVTATFIRVGDVQNDRKSQISLSLNDLKEPLRWPDLNQSPIIFLSLSLSRNDQEL